jgi:LAS superfamily LD-carboxypeptidase LdcB
MSIPTNPEDIAFGDLNSFLRRKRNPISSSELERRQKEDHINPNVLNEIPGPLVAIAIKSERVPLPYSITDSTATKTGQDILIVKARIVELDRCPHPNEKIQFLDGSGEISSNELELLHDDFVAINSKVTDKPNPGDFVLVDYENRATRTGPKYFGLKEISTAGIPTGKQSKEQNLFDRSKNALGLGNTTTAPNDGSPVPVQNSQNPTPTTTRTDCQAEKAKQKQPGSFPVTTGGPPPPGGYEMMDMAIVGDNQGLGIVLFPKKYIHVFEEMRAAYKKETGNVLGVTSGYRSINLQRCMYEDYLKNPNPNKTPVGNPDKIRPPGTSVHTAGTAADLNTYATENRKFIDFFTTTDTRSSSYARNVFEKEKNGDFGPVAKWLSMNSEKFAFRWTGYKFKELWHYDFDVDLAIRLGKIKER